MDSYLEIAEQVLRLDRRPLGPRDILRRAYERDLVPARLYGKTQHKTLQARLSEDILTWRDRSAFFRTAPGRFFLREFIQDPSIPEEFRVPIIGRRRKRELMRPNVLAMTYWDIAMSQDAIRLPSEAVLHAIEQHRYRYVPDVAHASPNEMVLWSFVIVTRDAYILTYRQGRYREDRDPFVQRRTIGFYTPVVDEDRGLFDQADHGIVTTGLKALSLDLGFSGETFWQELTATAQLECFVRPEPGVGRDLLGVVRFECPDWFEPLTRRLAMNDLRWHDMRAPLNHIEDFDPWSQVVLHEAQRAVSGKKARSAAAS